MKRFSLRLLLVCPVLALSACALPTVRALHSPFHPTSTDRVTFTAEATAPKGVAEISIVGRLWGQNGFCAAYVAGKCVPLPTFSVRTIKTCTFERPAEAAHCEATVDPFADGSFVTYGAKVKDAIGQTAEDLWIGFAAGAQADPNEPVAIYTRDRSDKAIDVVLIPVDYDGTPGRSYRDFVSDARGLVVNGYLAHPEVTDQRSKWNFYANPVAGGLTQVIVSGNVASQSVTEPLNWSHISPLADVVGYVHHNVNWRDFAVFNDTGTAHFTLQAWTPGTIMHETGHAVFGLDDEYCCDGGQTTAAWPHDNLFDDLASCQTSATAHGVAAASCTQLSGTNGFCGGVDAAGKPVLGGTNGKWRQDTAGDLMSCGGNVGAAGGVLDAARIRWYYQSL